MYLASRTNHPPSINDGAPDPRPSQRRQMNRDASFGLCGSLWQAWSPLPPFPSDQQVLQVRRISQPVSRCRNACIVTLWFLLDSTKNHQTCPAVTMGKTNLRSSWRNLSLILVRQLARNFPSCTQCCSLVWSDVAFDHWPTRMNTCVLRTVFQATELQACHRVFAPSRGDQDRERVILLLPHLFALLR